MSQRKIIYTLIANNFPLHIPRVTYFAPTFHRKSQSFSMLHKVQTLLLVVDPNTEKKKVLHKTQKYCLFWIIMGRQLWQTSPLIVGFLQLSHGWSKPVCIFGVFNVKMVWHTINIVCHYCCGRGGSRTHLSITAQPHLSRVAHYRSVHLPRN